jgi:hypothetical protein
MRRYINLLILLIGCIMGRKVPSLKLKEEGKAEVEEFDGVFHQDIDRLIIKHQEGSAQGIEMLVEETNDLVEKMKSNQWINIGTKE